MKGKLKVAVLGARDIGKYHAREFHNAGAHVVAVLGRSEKSSSEAASRLSKDFGIDNAHPYSELERLIEQEHPDIVSRATSNNSHYQICDCCFERRLPCFFGEANYVVR